MAMQALNVLAVANTRRTESYDTTMSLKPKTLLIYGLWLSTRIRKAWLQNSSSGNKALCIVSKSKAAPAHMLHGAVFEP
ncbi:hypothetical protein CGRA01v4_04162 [Colletotrichum graminicola]|nr:hypothetical protein CGRA01v4_04162 [Colletotrichum graminicola]